MDVYCLRVHRNLAGRNFAFDRVYLAKNGEHGVFKQMFRYALILPVETNLKSLLLDTVKIDNGVTHEFNRNDKAEGITHAMWTGLLAVSDWVMAVPILPKFVASNLPRYLTAAGKYRSSTQATTEVTKSLVRGRRRRMRTVSPGAVEEPFPSLTYLQTPEQNIRPVCVACPRFIMHQNGHCRLGEPICYDSLGMGLQNHFDEGMKEPPPPANVLLQEE